MRSPSNLTLSLVLVVGVLAAYAPLWNNDFVNFDDDKHIAVNPDVLHGLSMDSVRWAWTYDAPYWMPLTRMSFQLDAELFGSKSGEVTPALAAAVHGHNLFWHVAGVLLLFAFLQRLTGARWRSFLVAALFGLHPMHVESVAWAVERKDVLSCFFGILTLWAYVRFQEHPSWSRYLAIVAAFTLSLLAKPMLMTLPFVLLLLDYWPLQRKARVERLLLEKIPLLLLSACIAAVTMEARSSNGSLVSLNTLPLSARAGNALIAYTWYLKTTFYPWSLAVLYPHLRGSWSVLGASSGLVVLLTLTVLCWRMRKSQPWLLVGWLWFVGSLLPVIGFAQGGRQAWADRFSYWPHIGLFLAVVWGLAGLAERLRVPARVLALGSVVLLAILAVRTGVQVTHWRDSGTMWEQALAVTTDNDLAHEYLAVWLRQQGHPQEADHHLLEAVRIQQQRMRASLSPQSIHASSVTHALSSSAVPAPSRP